MAKTWRHPIIGVIESHKIQPHLKDIIPKEARTLEQKFIGAVDQLHKHYGWAKTSSATFDEVLKNHNQRCHGKAAKLVSAMHEIGIESDIGIENSNVAQEGIHTFGLFDFPSHGKVRVSFDAYETLIDDGSYIWVVYDHGVSCAKKKKEGNYVMNHDEIQKTDFKTPLQKALKEYFLDHY